MSMRLGRILETILTIVMLALIVMIVLGIILVLEVVNFVLGTNVSTVTKVSAFTYLGLTFAIVIYIAGVKIYNLRRYC